MLHWAILVAICNATLTTEKYCKLQRGFAMAVFILEDALSVRTDNASGLETQYFVALQVAQIGFTRRIF